MRGKLLASWASAAILMTSPLLVMFSEPTNAKSIKSAIETERQVKNTVPHAATERLLERTISGWKIARTPRASACPWAMTEVYRQVETKNFKVYICSAEGDYNTPKYYLGIAKNNGNRIAIPISNYDPETEIYAARNGSYTYVLRMGVRDLMVITPNGKRYIEELLEIGE